MKSRTLQLGLLPFFALGLHISDVAACGCFAPPVPTEATESFAVNQQAEQIIFEVQEGKISAHVRILYQGDPDEFAWLLPLPGVPELELSNSMLFGLVDSQTGPVTSFNVNDICPEQRYSCRTHSTCYDEFYGGGGDDAAPEDNSSADDGGDSDSAGLSPGAVEVLARERIGSYDTVTFAADEAGAAVDWLNENGFIINETMSPYMQPYLDEGMVFIASKLVPGAKVDEIRPLRMTYESDRPSIPLQLTAIAAEPHMMVTSFIYADTEYDPAYVPLTKIPEVDLALGSRSNYPMLLSRVVDEAGGNAFVKEYSGPGPTFREPTGCCSEDGDWCGVGGDGVCQCPGFEFDRADCANDEEITEAVQMLSELRNTYPVFTRLSSRVSPEEMNFNPEFEPARSKSTVSGTLLLAGSSDSLGYCESQVIDQDAYQEAKLLGECATTYCDLGECVVTELGVGCRCDEGAAARAFTDSDGLPSLTCVPEVGTVDFAAGGLELPDACRSADVDDGACVDVGGFAAVVCDEDRGASLVAGSPLPQCADVLLGAGDKGARDYSDQLREFDVCAPPPPACAVGGWLVEREVDNAGVECDAPPDASWFEEQPELDCSDYYDDDGTDWDLVDESYDELREQHVANSEYVDTSKPRPTLASNDAGATAGHGDDTDDAETGDGAATAGDDPATDSSAIERTGKSRNFCNVSAVGVPTGAAAISGGLFLAAGLLLSRRRKR